MYLGIYVSISIIINRYISIVIAQRKKTNYGKSKYLLCIYLIGYSYSYKNKKNYIFIRHKYL